MLQMANHDAFRPALAGSVSHDRQKFMAGSIQTRPGASSALRQCAPTAMRDEQRRAKELQFQMRLLSSMISDGVPRHKQPDWASVFHKAAIIIQSVWRVRKQRHQARKITELMDDTINVFMEQTNWGGWEVVNDPFKLLAARQAAEFGGSETDSYYSDSETSSSSEASDDGSDFDSDADDDCGGDDDDDMGADGSGDNDRDADFSGITNGENEDDDPLRQWRRVNTLDGYDSTIPGRSIERKQNPLPSKAKSQVALMLRDMNNRLKDQLSRASNGQDIDAVSKMGRRLLRVGSSLAALKEDAQQGSSERIKDQLSRASNEQDRMSRRRLGFGSSLTVLQEDHVRTAQGSSDRSSAMSNNDESGQGPNVRGSRSSEKSNDKSKHGPGDEGNRSRTKQVMAVFKRAARAVGKVNENLQCLRNHRASLNTDGQQGGGTDEDAAEAVRNDIKKHARRAHFHVKGLQDAMAAELKRTFGEQGGGEILKDTESAQALMNNRLTLLTSLAEDTDGYNGIVLSPAAEGPLDGWKFDAIHRELSDLCSSVNQVKKEIKHNSRTAIRDQSAPTQPQQPPPQRDAPGLSPSLDITAAVCQVSLPAALQPPVTVTVKTTRAQSPEDGRERLDPIPRDKIGKQRTRVKLRDEKSNVSCQVALLREATANPRQSLPPMEHKKVHVPTSSNPLHPGFSIDDILQAQRQRAQEQTNGRSGRHYWSTDSAKDQSPTNPNGGLRFARLSAESPQKSTSVKQKSRRSAVDMPIFLKGNTVETKGADSHSLMPAVDRTGMMSLQELPSVLKAPAALSQGVKINKQNRLMRVTLC